MTTSMAMTIALKPNGLALERSADIEVSQLHLMCLDVFNGAVLLFGTRQISRFHRPALDATSPNGPT